MLNRRRFLTSSTAVLSFPVLQFPHLQTPPNQDGTPAASLSPSLCLYIADGLGKTIALIRAKRAQSKDLVTAGRLLKLFAHQLEDGGTDSWSRQFAGNSDLVFDLSAPPWSRHATSFLQQYDVRISRKSTEPESIPSPAELKAMKETVVNDGISRYFFAAAQLLKNAAAGPNSPPPGAAELKLPALRLHTFVAGSSSLLATDIPPLLAGQIATSLFIALQGIQPQLNDTFSVLAGVIVSTLFHLRH
jgi:hypothetical protein